MTSGRHTLFLMWKKKKKKRLRKERRIVNYAELSWHVQTCGLFISSESKLEQKKFAKDLNYGLVKLKADFKVLGQGMFYRGPFCANDRNIRWVTSRRCGSLATWFCYQMSAKPDNMRAVPLWPNSYAWRLLSLFKTWLNVCLCLLEEDAAGSAVGTEGRSSVAIGPTSSSWASRSSCSNSSNSAMRSSWKNRGKINPCQLFYQSFNFMYHQFCCNSTFEILDGISLTFRELSKIYSLEICVLHKSWVSYENFRLKFSMCAQSHALGACTKFQLESLVINHVISGVVHFRKIILESLWNVSKTNPTSLWLNFCICYTYDSSAYVCRAKKNVLPG